MRLAWHIHAFGLTILCFLLKNVGRYSKLELNVIN